MKSELNDDGALVAIKASLIALEEGMKASDTNTMLESMRRLEELVQGRRDSLHPQLVHFLERRSYAKAMAFVGGAEEVARGSCAPRGGPA